MKKGKFNHDNNILEYLDLITNDYKLIKEDIIDELTTTKYETYIPYHYFKQIPVQMLANENIEDAVINKIGMWPKQIRTCMWISMTMDALVVRMFLNGK